MAFIDPTSIAFGFVSGMVVAWAIIIPIGFWIKNRKKGDKK